MELKFVSREGDYLIFETSDGTRAQALLDDQVRDAIRKVQQAENPTFTPREVQQQIRAGFSLAEVAAKLGAPESAVEPFALPILDEIRYVLDAALNTTLPDGPTMKRFEDMVLASDPNATFTAIKSDLGWEIIAKGAGTYNWLFDLRSRVIEPNGESARKIGKAGSIRDSIFEAPTREEAPEPLQASEQVETKEPEGASVHDLVQELRARREQSAAELKPHSAKGRAALPSWDEIVLGTGSLDTDAD
jgi:hypothetical protein